MKRLRVFFGGKIKGGSLSVGMRFCSIHFLQGHFFFPAPLLSEVQMYRRFVIKDEIYPAAGGAEGGVGKKQQNNQKIHHFSVTSFAAWTPFLLQSHFVRLQLIFTRCRCYRCQPAMITTTRPRRSSSKMIPIWIFFFFLEEG